MLNLSLKLSAQTFSLVNLVFEVISANVFFFWPELTNARFLVYSLSRIAMLLDATVTAATVVSDKILREKVRPERSS